MTTKKTMQMSAVMQTVCVMPTSAVLPNDNCHAELDSTSHVQRDSVSGTE